MSIAIYKMPLLIFLFSIFLSTITLPAHAQEHDMRMPMAVNPAVPLRFITQAEEIDLALGSAPLHLRSAATVYVFGAQGYQKVRQGNNGFSCLVNRDGQQAGDPALRPTCWDTEGAVTILPVMLRVGELLAKGKSAHEIKDDIAAGYIDGRFIKPRRTGIAYMLRGDILYDSNSKKITTIFPPHYMVYAPDVKDTDIGATTESGKQHNALPFIYSGYSGGAQTAYLIMFASEDRK